MTLLFMSSSTNIFTLLYPNSVHHVGAHPGGHQRGVSILGISINSYTEYSSDLNLGQEFAIFTSFHFPDSGLYLLNGFDFDFDLFWMA